MKILSIGNSFSQDATRYLHQIANAAGNDLTTVNLYIGGCSLETHWKNAQSGEPAYTLERNGEDSGAQVSLTDAFSMERWDAVTIQQASHFSFSYETYQPYGSSLIKYIQSKAPKSEIVVHETWAYEDGSARLREVAGFSSAADMLHALREAYRRLSHDGGGLRVIPSGELLFAALGNGFPSVHRDTFHASIPCGRYLLGGLWHRFFLRTPFTGNAYLPEGMTPQEQTLCQTIVDTFCQTRKDEFFL